jgi:hypothetical protein
MLANCLTRLYLLTNETLYLAHLPPTATPTRTNTPSVTPGPSLVVSIKAGAPYGYGNGWNVPLTVIVTNKGTGPAKGKITVLLKYWQAPSTNTPNPQTQGSTQLAITDFIPAGGQVSGSTEIYMDYYTWINSTANFQAFLGKMQSNVANVVFPSSLGMDFQELAQNGQTGG